MLITGTYLLYILQIWLRLCFTCFKYFITVSFQINALGVYKMFTILEGVFIGEGVNKRGAFI